MLLDFAYIYSNIIVEPITAKDTTHTGSLLYRSLATIARITSILPVGELPVYIPLSL